MKQKSTRRVSPSLPRTIRIPRTAAPRYALALLLAVAAPALYAEDVARDQRDANLKQAEANYDVAKATCKQLAGNAADVCNATAKRDRDTFKADAEADYDPTVDKLVKAVVTRADGDYDVAKQVCDAKDGNARDVCRKDAEAAHVQAVANAKADREVIKARLEAARKIDKAALAAARERCDTYKGERKDACLSDAKAHFAND